MYNEGTMNHVALCCVCELRSYRRLSDYPFGQITGDLFSNIGSQCRFVIKRGHTFTIPFRVKFIHLISLPKWKSRILWKLRALSRLWSLNIHFTENQEQYKITLIHVFTIKHGNHSRQILKTSVHYSHKRNNTSMLLNNAAFQLVLVIFA